jgi:hypothetical protein
MTHDGSGRISKVSPPEEIMPDIQSPAIVDDNQLSKTLLRGMIWFWNTHKLNVALINRIEFRDSKVFTMIVESFTAPIKLKFMMTIKFVDEIKKSRKLLEVIRDTSPSEVGPLESWGLNELRDAIEEEDLSESYLLATYGVSKILKAKDGDVFMASAFILHSIILKHIPLSKRRLPLITFDADFEEQIKDFLAEISDVFRQTMENPQWDEMMAKEEVVADAIDLVDGRLFRVVIQAMEDDSLHGVVPRAAQPDWALLCGIISDLTDEELSLKGSTEPEFSKTTARKGDFDVESEELAVLPFTNAVFDKHLECIHVKTDSALPAQFGKMKIYRETSHWHNHKKPLNPKVLPAQKVSKWK